MKTLIGAGLAAIGVALVLFIRGLGGASDVPTLTVEPAPFVRTVIAEGNLSAVNATPIAGPPGTESPMRIAWIAPDGTRVAKDEVVMRLDPTDLE